MHFSRHHFFLNHLMQMFARPQKWSIHLGVIPVPSYRLRLTGVLPSIPVKPFFSPLVLGVLVSRIPCHTRWPGAVSLVDCNPFEGRGCVCHFSEVSHRPGSRYIWLAMGAARSHTSQGSPSHGPKKVLETLPTSSLPWGFVSSRWMLCVFSSPCQKEQDRLG